MGTPIAIVGYAEGRDEIVAWLRALVALNVSLLGLEALPALYRSGVRFEPEPRLRGYPERFDPAPVVYRRGWGDCDDLAAWRAAELRRAGERADIDLRETARSTRFARRWHAVVLRADGSIEDPSALLIGRR